MIWQVIEERMGSGTDTVIIPVGTDLSEQGAVRAAEELGNVLVAPLVKTTLLGERLLRPDTVTKMLKEYCKSLAGQAFQAMKSEGKGFKNVFMAPNSEEFFGAVDTAMTEMSKDLKDIKIAAPTKVPSWREAIRTKRSEDIARFLVDYVKETS